LRKNNVLLTLAQVASDAAVCGLAREGGGSGRSDEWVMAEGQCFL